MIGAALRARALAWAIAPIWVAVLPAPRLSAQEGPRLYVANQGSASVSVIDAESGRVLDTVDLQALGFDANCRPHDTDTDPDGRHWYVSLIGGGHVLKFDRENRLVARAPFETPGLLAMDGESPLFVGRSMMAVDPPRRIGLIDRSSMEIEELDVIFPRPHALALNGAAGRVYAASLAENRVAALDVDTEDLSLLDVKGSPHAFVHFALSPDRSRLVATAQLTGRLMVFDARSPELKLEKEIDVGRQPWHPVFAPDGERVYFGLLEEDAVVAVETRGWTVQSRLSAPGIAQPHGAAISEDGRYLFVSNRNLEGAYKPSDPELDPTQVGTVVQIDTETFEVMRTIEVGAYPAGISLGAGR